MPIDDARLYDEAGHAWRHFASWREKTFAGYLTALAALAFAFIQNSSVPLRTAILAATILVSAVFWILENRSRELITACQLAADRLEAGKGCYAELDQIGFERKSRLTYGGAVGVLVSGVLALSLAGLGVHLIRWATGPGPLSLWRSS